MNQEAPNLFQYVLQSIRSGVDEHLSGISLGRRKNNKTQIPRTYKLMENGYVVFDRRMVQRLDDFGVATQISIKAGLPVYMTYGRYMPESDTL